MSDIINDLFKKFYPKNLKPSDFEFSNMFGGMLSYRGKGGGGTIFPEIFCADGFHFSAQGHYGAYSHPRDDFADHYSAVEIGFPSEKEDLFMPFVMDAERPTDTVYSYVPIEVVCKVIECHGGFDEAKTAAAITAANADEARAEITVEDVLDADLEIHQALDGPGVDNFEVT
jgi:hypothetical protein